MERPWKMNPTNDDLIEALMKVHDLLYKQMVHYRLIGGMALEIQGVEVGTKDVDVLVEYKDFDLVRQLFSKHFTPQTLTDARRRVLADEAESPALTFVGDDGTARPVSFFRAGHIEVDVLGAAAEPEELALDVSPTYSVYPRGIPVAQIPAIVAIKLTSARAKDIVHVENVARTMGGDVRDAQALSKFLREHNMGHLVEEWEAAFTRATGILVNQSSTHRRPKKH